MDVRPIAAPDVPAWHALRLRALREHPLAFTSSHDEEALQGVTAASARLAQPHVRFWGAFEGGELRGMVGLERKTREKERHKAVVVAMYVPAEHAHRGIGRALLSALIGHAGDQALRLLVLTVTQGNDAALALYERAGFRAFGLEPDAIRVEGRGHAKVHMALRL